MRPTPAAAKTRRRDSRLRPIGLLNRASVGESSNTSSSTASVQQSPGQETAMTKREELLMEFRHELATTRRVLERIPADKLTWKPHQKSMSLGSLAMHIASLPGGGQAARGDYRHASLHRAGASAVSPDRVKRTLAGHTAFAARGAADLRLARCRRRITTPISCSRQIRSRRSASSPS